MTKFNRIFYLFFTCIILYSCTTAPVPKALKTAEQGIETTPNPAFRILQQFNTNAIKSMYNSALSALLMSKVFVLSYVQKFIDSSDSINKLKPESSFASSEKKYKYTVLQISNQSLIIKNNQNNRFLLVALLTLSVLLVVFMFRRLKVREKELEYHKDIAKRKEELMAIEKINIAKENENHFLLERQLKLQSILLANIKMHQYNIVRQPDLWRNASKETITSQFGLLHNETKHYIDIKYNNLTSRLKDKYPALTENDIFISCLILTDFDTGMIATIFNVHVESITKQRHRLRKKLNLVQSDKLMDFLQHF